MFDLSIFDAAIDREIENRRLKMGCATSVLGRPSTNRIE
jgi:hypothetical protein